MPNKQILLCLFMLFTGTAVHCDRSTSISALERDIEQKDELIAMLRVKTISEQELIEKQEKQIDELNARIINLNEQIARNDLKNKALDKDLLGYVQQTNKCQFSSCLCKPTGEQTIKIPGNEPFQVSCDSDLAGSGWTVIQRRRNGSVDFNRNWRDYQKGFGDLQGDFFIGLEKLHSMTKSQPHELYIFVQNLQNESRYALYNNFVVGDEDASFDIEILGDYSGTAGDGMIFHKNMKFSTFDLDNDNSSRNCADENSSGWWFNNCYHCNLNGPYNSGFYWYPWQRNVLKTSQMMIRPKTY